MNIIKTSFLLLISFAVIALNISAKENRIGTFNSSKENPDSLKASHENKQLLQYSLKHNSNNTSLNSINPGKKLNNTESFMLNDGTTWFYESEVNTARLLTMLGTVVTIDVVGYFRLKDLQYHWPVTKFHSYNFKLDFNTYKLMDKYGHFMHAYFAGDLFSRGYRWSGISGESSIYYGALSSWLWMLQIEIADGFFEAWGFSWGDLIFNTLGSGFALLQQMYPEALGGLQPKVSYHESDALKKRKYNNGAKSAIDDYEGITWWLGVNVFHYMPQSVQKDYPDWLKPLGFAVGQSAKGIADNPQRGVREIFFGLDFDLRQLSYGNESGIIRFLKNELNIIRLPLPAVKITPNGVWYGLYF